MTLPFSLGLMKVSWVTRWHDFNGQSAFNNCLGQCLISLIFASLQEKREEKATFWFSHGEHSADFVIFYDWSVQSNMCLCHYPHTKSVIYFQIAHNPSDQVVGFLWWWWLFLTSVSCCWRSQGLSRQINYIHIVFVIACNYLFLENNSIT